MTKCTLPPSKNYVVNIQITQSISTFLSEFASFNGVQPESLIFWTTPMANMNIPSSVTALGLMRDQETALTVFMRDRERTSRRRNHPTVIVLPKTLNQKITAESTDQVQVDLESTLLQSSEAQPNPSPANLDQKISDPESVDTSDPSDDATHEFLQLMSGKSSNVRGSLTNQDQKVGAHSDEQETDPQNDNACSDLKSCFLII